MGIALPFDSHAPINAAAATGGSVTSARFQAAPTGVERVAHTWLWLGAIALIVLAVASMVSKLFLIPHLDDEFFSVDFIGVWFSSHLAPYILQWQMTAYPPQSPVFGNGFLPPYLFGIAVALGHGLIAPLYEARLVNFCCVLLTAVLLYLYLRSKLEAPFAALGAALYLSLPVTTYAGGTAYFEPLLGLEFMALLLLVDADERGNLRKAILIALVLAFGLLTKVSVLVPWAFLAARLGYLALSDRATWSKKHALAAMLLPPFFAAILWPGARDPRELAGIFNFFFHVRDDMGVLPRLPFLFNLTSYAIMAVATVSSGVVAAAIIAGVVGRRLLKRTARFWAIAAFVATYLLFLGVAVHSSTRHQIITVQPFVAVLITFALYAATKDLKVPLWLARALVALSLISAAFTTLFMPGPNVGLYASSLATTTGLTRLYLSGTGELEKDAAEWIAANSSGTHHVCNLAQDYTMAHVAPYLAPVSPLFVTDKPGDVLSRHCDYLVMYDWYLRGAGTLSSMLRRAAPVHVVRSPSVDLVIFRVRTHRTPISERWCGLEECKPPEYATLMRGASDFDLKATFPHRSNRFASVVTLVDAPYTDADAIHISFLFRASGCSFGVVGISAVRSVKRWAPGHYDRFVSDRNCNKLRGKVPFHSVDYTYAVRSARGRFALRAGTDATFGTQNEVEIRDLRLAQLNLTFR